MAQTIEQLRMNLMTPDYGVAYIIANNAEDVADNLRSQGFIVSDADGIVEALNSLLAAGNRTGFISALSVPVRLDRITDQELAVLAEASKGVSDAAGMPMAKNSDGSFDVGALFGGLATGYLSYMQLSGQQQVNPQQAAANQPPAPPRDNSMSLVLGIIAIVVVVVVVVMISKGKK
jgi:hypothetical protein